MSNKQEIASSLNEIWGKLSLRWTGEDSHAFYQQYIAKMTEIVNDFGEACSDLSIGSANLAKKLQLVEHDLL